MLYFLELLQRSYQANRQDVFEANVVSLVLNSASMLLSRQESSTVARINHKGLTLLFFLTILNSFLLTHLADRGGRCSPE